MKKLHNKLAFEAQKKGKEANIQSDNLNSKFSPSFRTAKIVKQIPSYITIIFGIVTTLQGFALFRGSVSLTPEFVGITSAGMGIFLAGISSLFTFEDDTFHLLLVARANQDQLLADTLAIKTRLSFLKIELIDFKRNYIKEPQKKSQYNSEAE